MISTLKGVQLNSFVAIVAADRFAAWLLSACATAASVVDTGRTGNRNLRYAQTPPSCRNGEFRCTMAHDLCDLIVEGALWHRVVSALAY